MTLDVRRLGRVCVVAVALLGPLPTARADRTHVVGPGQTLAQIAKKYRVSVASLRALNGLSEAGSVRQGQALQVPDPGTVVVRPGQTLAAIARAHHVTVEDLRRENNLSARSHLRPGTRLAIPGESVELASIAPGARSLRAVNTPILFTRVATKKTAKVALLDRRGRPSGFAAARLGELMRPRKFGGRVRLRRPDPRLVAALAAVTSHFGGKPVQIISGFRAVAGYTKNASRHTKGRAMDFRIEGVRNEVVRDFCRTLPNVGVGYYPNSSFVHLDVRDRSAYWVDWSHPGEAPKYGKRRAVLAVDSNLDAAEEGESLDVLDVEGLDTTTDGGAAPDHDEKDAKKAQSASDDASSAPPSVTSPPSP